MGERALVRRSAAAPNNTAADCRQEQLIGSVLGLHKPNDTYRSDAWAALASSASATGALDGCTMPSISG